MRAQFGKIVVEGTTKEIADLIRELNDEQVSDFAAAADDDSRWVSEDLAFRVLKRRALSPEQRAVLGKMKANHPAWTTFNELLEATGYSTSQLSGLLGAFGKRVYSTEGYEDDTYFFDQEWDYENDANRYRLPDSAYRAVIRAGI
jgi:hypothetical protein